MHDVADSAPARKIDECATNNVIHLPDAAGDPVLIQHAVEIRRLGRRLIDDLIEIGRRLTDAKTHARGHWLNWLEHEFGWSDDTARRYMQLYQFAQENFEFRKLRNLQLPASGLYLLAQAKCPPEARK